MPIVILCYINIFHECFLLILLKVNSIFSVGYTEAALKFCSKLTKVWEGGLLIKGKVVKQTFCVWFLSEIKNIVQKI